MANILTAGNSSNGGTAISTDTSGTLNIVTGSGSGANAITIDASQNVTIAKGVTGTPAFSAYPSGSQSVTTSTWTKLQYNTEEFDTNSNYDNVTNYRFTPTVAGYYSFTAGAILATTVSRTILGFYKNGSLFKAFDLNYSLNSVSGATLIYLNGSTDYVELYAYIVGTTPSVSNGSVYAFFQASMVRGA